VLYGINNHKLVNSRLDVKSTVFTHQ